MGTRYHHLDGLRGIAALMVVFHHAAIAYSLVLITGLTDGEQNTALRTLSNVPFLPAAWGQLPVCIFFLISGYVLAVAYLRTSLGVVQVLFKRYTRLTLPIITGCILGYLARLNRYFDAYLNLRSDSSLTRDVVLSPSLSDATLQGLTAVFRNRPPEVNYDGVVWTMPIEFTGSVLLALIVIGTKKNTFWRIPLLVAITTVFVQGYIGLFGIGALCALVMPDGPKRLPSDGLKCFILLIAGVALGTWPRTLISDEVLSAFAAYRSLWDAVSPRLTARYYLYDADSALHAVGALLVFTGILRSCAAQRVLSSPIPQWLGAVSFPLYLYHVPLGILVYCSAYIAIGPDIFGEFGRFIISALSGIAVSLVIATLVGLKIERFSILVADVLGRALEASARRLGRPAQATR